MSEKLRMTVLDRRSLRPPWGAAASIERLPRPGPRHGVGGVLLMALSASLLAACAPSPAPVYLTLPGLPINAAASSSFGAGSAVASGSAPAPVPSPTTAPVLAVRRVTIPEYMVTRRVRYRAEPSTLAEWPNTFWGERIELGVSREFVEALRQQLPGWTLCDNNCGDQIPALSLQLDLVPMDYLRSTKSLQARARITLTDGSLTPRMLLSDERAYELAAADDTAQGEARAIAELVRQVARDAAPFVLATPAQQLSRNPQERTR